MMKVVCPYCHRSAELVTGDEIYPHRPDLFPLFFWLCKECDAYVGTHENSSQHAPLGRLANAELRSAKQAAHFAFDPLWKRIGMTRNEAYRWLAEQLSIPASACHVGEFDVEMCRRVVRICGDLERT